MAMGIEHPHPPHRANFLFAVLFFSVAIFFVTPPTQSPVMLKQGAGKAGLLSQRGNKGIFGLSRREWTVFPGWGSPRRFPEVDMRKQPKRGGFRPVVGRRVGMKS
eukprot:741966-Amorphochlora_amoeboformis.AAC.1